MDRVLEGQHNECQVIDNPNLKENCQDILADNCARINSVEDRDRCYMDLVVNGDFGECSVFDNSNLRESCERIVASN